MFYEECEMGGVLWFRTTPGGEWERVPTATVVATLRQQLADEREASERLRVQLAGCGVAAMSNTEESYARAAEVVPGVYGHSASYSDCLAAARREIDLRQQLAEAQARVAERDAQVAALVEAAKDVNEWLCRTEREGTAHQRLLAQRLAPFKEAK